VTASEIQLVLLGGCSSAGTVLDDLDDPGSSTAPAAPAYAGMFRYFGDRFQLYGRRVHGWLAHVPCNDVRAGYLDVLERLKPFAILGAGDSTVLATEASQRQVLSSVRGGDRQFMHARQPYVISSTPDVQSYAANLVGFICEKLAGRPARYSGELPDRVKPRRFAMLYDRGADPDQLGAKLIVEGVGQRCGHQVGPIQPSSGNAAQDMAKWARVDGVTTVLQFGNSVTWLAAADATGWHPEWTIVPNTCCSAGWAAGAPKAQMLNAFGVWFERRWSEQQQGQEWYQAQHEGCPDCTGAVGNEIYNEMLLFFWGIQAAGPRLTPANVDRGLHAIPQRPSPNPYTPAAYFGAPDDHSFVKDAAVIRWDSTGTPPGQPAPGCWRLVEDGKRYRAEDWAIHPGDDDFDRTPAWPCQGFPNS
jgi:hypothetical protein